LKQRRLSDTGLAADHDRAPAVAKTIYQPVQDCGLLLALDQLGAGVDQGHPAHLGSMSVARYSVEAGTMTYLHSRNDLGARGVF
jgi:hypothetical protein